MLDILNIKEYICSYEDSIVMIKEGINRYSKKECYKVVNNHGMFVSINRIVRNKFCLSNYDEHGNVYLFDELNAQKITEYILKNPEYELDFELAYCLVCYILQKEINRFYKELDLYKKDGTVRLYLSKAVHIQNLKKAREKYMKAMDARIVTGYKRIRRK